MADDARLSTALPRHPKTVKLKRRLRADGCWALVCLFLWVADNRSDGNLSGLTSEDIEIAAEWEGDPGLFVSTLSDLGFLDGGDGSYSIHDWEEHNPFAATRGKRVAAAKKAAAVRWGCDSDAERMHDAQKGNAHHHTTPHITKQKRATSFPEGYQPNQAHKDLAAELGINLRESFPAFRDHHQAKGSTFKDWDAALRNWLRNDRKFSRQIQTKPPAHDSRPNDSWMVGSGECRSVVAGWEGK